MHGGTGKVAYISVIENTRGGVEACAGNRPDPTPIGSGNAAVLTAEDLGSGKARFFDVPKIDYFGPAGPNFAYFCTCFLVFSPLGARSRQTAISKKCLFRGCTHSAHFV